MSSNKGTNSPVAAFETAVDLIVDIEGGYVNDPDDPGGETKFGISKRAFPDIDIANLTEEDAASLYKEHYWNKAGCTQIASLDAGLALTVFDHAVNCGVERAVEILQQLAGSTVDGVFGPNTHGAAKRWIENAPDDPSYYEYPTNQFTRERVKYYVSLGKAKYVDGWLNRVLSIHNHAVDEATIQGAINA